MKLRMITAVLLLSLPMTVAARTCKTTFPATENPISQGGIWINGQRGVNWYNVQTTPGFAFGTQTGVSGYNDSTALLTGPWRPAQWASATVHIVQGDTANNEELELRLRSNLLPLWATGYEIEWSDKPYNQYMGIIRWNGKLGDFTELIIVMTNCGGQGLPCYVQDGDVISARAIGSVISAYINGILVAEVTDNTFPTGLPGIGFGFNNTGGNGQDSNFGFSSFVASDDVLWGHNASFTATCQQ